MGFSVLIYTFKKVSLKKLQQWWVDHWGKSESWKGLWLEFSNKETEGEKYRISGERGLTLRMTLTFLEEGKDR